MAHPELAADLFHIDSMAFVRQARIPRDDKEPADTAEGSDDLLGHSAQVKNRYKTPLNRRPQQSRQSWGLPMAAIEIVPIRSPERIRRRRRLIPTDIPQSKNLGR